MSDIKLSLAGAVSVSCPEPNASGEDPPSETAQILQLAEDLSPEEQAQVDTYAQQINLHASLTSVEFGGATQNQLRPITESVLQLVSRHDISEVGELLTEMVSNISSLTTDEPKAKVRSFFKPAKKPETLQAKYTRVSQDLDRKKKQLDGQYDTLLVDVELLDEKLQQLTDCYKSLSICIAAGRRKLAEARAVEAANLQQKAHTTQNPIDAAKYNDFVNQCNAFSGRLQDLAATQTACQQTMTLVQLTINTYKQLAQKIQSSTSNAIPIWQNNISTALVLQDGQELMKLGNSKLLSTLDEAITLQRAAHERQVDISKLQL